MWERYSMKKAFLILYFLLCISPVFSQKKEIDVSILPIIFYLPETSLGLGTTVILTHNTKDRDSTEHRFKRNSNIQPSFAYTLKNQLLFYIPYELYLKDGKYRIDGELGYYRYFYNFYGIGPNSKIENKETYDVNFPRIRINALRGITEKLFVGINYRFDLYDIVGLEPNGLVEALTIPGKEGGVTSLIGPLIRYDSRDNNFYPRKGYYATLSTSSSFKAIGATYNYSTVEYSFSTYKTWGGDKTLAANFTTGATLGAAPFYEYFYISSPKRSRGFNDRRYMDRNLLLFQLEYKMHMIWRIDAVAFGSLASLDGNWLTNWEFNKAKTAGGLGIRFKLIKDQEIRLRCDVGYAEDQLNFYITIGEAF